MFSLFGIMFSTACISLDFEFCQRMMRIVDKLIHPFYRTPNGRAEQDCWYRGDYFYIKADQLANFKLDLKRVQLAEKLKMVRLIIFEKTKDPEAKVIVNGTPIFQNRWVYDHLLEFLPQERICYWEDSIPSLPPPPEVFWLLENMEGAPCFKDLKSRKVLDREALGKYFM